MEFGQYLQFNQCPFSTKISKLEESEMKIITGPKQFASAESLHVVFMSVFKVTSRQHSNSVTNIQSLGLQDSYIA